jgi:dCTP deaminase
MLKSDRWIRMMAKDFGMIEPFVDHQVREGVVSYGLSSYGYDMRLSDEFKIMGSGRFITSLSPKNVNEELFEDFVGKRCIILPHSFVLGRSVEYFRIPRNIVALCYSKSTYARIGVISNIGPLESEWEGHVTLEIANAGSLPVVVHAHEGIAQVLFFESDERCLVSYKDKKGIYQAQKGVTLPKIVGKEEGAAAD